MSKVPLLLGDSSNFDFFLLVLVLVWMIKQKLLDVSDRKVFFFFIWLDLLFYDLSSVSLSQLLFFLLFFPLKIKNGETGEQIKTYVMDLLYY